MPVSDSGSTLLTLDAAQKLLRRFICVDRPSIAPLPDDEQVRQAVLLVRAHSDYQIFGICADTIAQATAALTAYLSALRYEQLPTVPTVSIDGAVYLKYNPNTGRCHLDAYIGEHRGVLVSCQSAYDGDVNETFGHLPLDLFNPRS